MQVELQTAIVVGTQVGTTAGLGIVLKLILDKLKAQNGRIGNVEKEQNSHIKEYHSKK